MSKINIEVSKLELQNLKLVRNYFGERDKTAFEHLAYSFLDRVIDKCEIEKTPFKK